MKTLSKIIMAVVLMASFVSYTYGQASKTGNSSKSSYGGHEYVDLGLPSGTLWATCNVGANSPEVFGAYFAWGEKTTKSTYDWSTYQYCNGGYNKLTKYCNKSDYGNNGFTDNLTVLQAGDDAATTNWGSGWRMPTKAEWEELMNYTTMTWTTQNKVKGARFTASNGNSLFLPAAGYRPECGIDPPGTNGKYWSSSLYTEGPNGAWSLDLYSDSYIMFSGSRENGFSVRAVRTR